MPRVVYVHKSGNNSNQELIAIVEEFSLRKDTSVLMCQISRPNRVP